MKYLGDDFLCQGKREYETREEVMREIHRIIEESLGGVGASLRPYRCRFCGNWHITDTSKKGM